MGSIASPVQSIDSLDFKKIPEGKAIPGRFVWVNGRVLIQGAKGALYTNINPLRGKVHCAGCWGWSEDLIVALKELGLFSPEDMAKHEAYIARLRDEDDKYTAFRDLQTYAKSKAVKPAEAKKLEARIMAEWAALPHVVQCRLQYYKHAPAGAVVKPEPKG